MVNSSEPKQNPDQPPRILALDFGSKTIGLAVTDELGFTAQGLPTLRRSNKRYDLDHLRRTIRQYGVGEIVMGLPLRMSGSEGIQSEKVQAFAENLRRSQRTVLPSTAGLVSAASARWNVRSQRERRPVPDHAEVETSPGVPNRKRPTPLAPASC